MARHMRFVTQPDERGQVKRSRALGHRNSGVTRSVYAPQEIKTAERSAALDARYEDLLSAAVLA
jgi:hypothetical protein